MKARAIAKNIGMSPRKVRLVLDLIRGRGVNEAYSILKFSKKGADHAHREDPPLGRGQRHAGRRQGGTFVDVDELVVKEAYANEGPRLKRFSPRAMGRATPIIKRTTQLTIVVDRKE